MKRISVLFTIAHESVFPTHVGVFLFDKTCEKMKEVFPTHVGVFLDPVTYSTSSLGLPHARGGVSVSDIVVYGGSASSPRTWGCFTMTQVGFIFQGVFPTHVGVFPEGSVIEKVWLTLPHARGGVSYLFCVLHIYRRSSPRTWGCFSSFLL